MKILLPVDGSDCALRAVDHLIAHSAWFREVPEIHLLHVHAPIPIGRVQAHIGKETLQAYYLEEGQEQLSAAQARLDASGHFHTTHIHVGQPAEVIAKIAGELKCDLIVMGSHGRSGVAGLVMGSVASRVLHLASCPVLLVK
ncbi:universal stress protein [Dechloromonas sp. A34]|uniref:universal stress protein n=1 Tax=Dechloromonas sp. A34 TaxID=447588 RepID=UPI002248B765|nr:universal stress protein [Dechloromonas sp. A34]